MRDFERDDMAATLIEAKRSASAWRYVSIGDRLRIVRRFRTGVASDPRSLAYATPGQRPMAEILVSEILPLIEASRFLERNAKRILQPRRLGRRGRPLWLAGVDAKVHYEPYGAVLILAPANYPLFLPGVQILQAITAGNAVCVKPAQGCSGPMRVLAEQLHQAGLPAGVLTILDESVAAGRAAVEVGFDKIVLTGSAETGEAVMRAASRQLTSCTMELSGDDSVFVLPGADPALVSAAVIYGCTLNNGRTCIAPKRVFAQREAADALHEMLSARCSVPVIAVATMDDALALAAQSPYALGAAIFGPATLAHAFAQRVAAGCVVINDVIVPTADPRLPFGGRRRSGFGVTRGTEGLREMTVIKTISTRRGRFRPHLDAKALFDEVFFVGLIRMLHGRTWSRITAPAMMIAATARSARRRKREAARTK